MLSADVQQFKKISFWDSSEFFYGVPLFYYNLCDDIDGTLVNKEETSSEIIL